MIKAVGLRGINLQEGLRADTVPVSVNIMVQDAFAPKETEFFSENHVCIIWVDVMPNAGHSRQTGYQGILKRKLSCRDDHGHDFTLRGNADNRMTEQSPPGGFVIGSDPVGICPAADCGNC